MTKQLTRNDVKEIVTEIIEENNKYLKKEITDDIVKFKDEILGEIINLRDDFAVLTGYRDMIEDHGVRIEKLEQKVFPAKN